MKNTPLMITLLFLASANIVTAVNETTKNRREYVGLFKNSDQTLQGIIYGNWGSRPYEYAWASSVVNIEGKRVIDLGVGLPSQFNWYKYVMANLKPAFYAGVDYDGRIKAELITESNYEIRHMDMADLQYADKSFDIAYCISTFEHIPYEVFMACIKEAHRVLIDDGKLVITLDEEWDKDQATNYNNGWNTLEQSLIEKGLFKRKSRSFGLPEFLELIKDYFVLYQDDADIDPVSKTIRSSKDKFVYYRRSDKDFTILNSGLPTNSCVSYAVLRKK